MAKVTNVSRRLIHVADFMLIPGVPTDLPDNLMDNPTIQDMLKSGDLKEGEVEVKSELPQEPDNGDTGTMQNKNPPVGKK